MYLQSYESEGWSRSGSKSKKRKLRPEAELRRARRKIRNAKSKIRSVLRDVVTAVAGAKSEIQIPDEAYEDDFVDTEKICCAVCGSADATEGNDILLCDRAGCNKAFHQKCLNPIVTDCGDEDDDWYVVFQCSSAKRENHFITHEFEHGAHEHHSPKLTHSRIITGTATDANVTLMVLS